MPLNPGPLNYWRHRSTALVLLALARREAALAVFSAMLDTWPEDAHSLASRSHLNAELGRRDEALADALTLAQVHPRRSAADWFNLAYLLDEAGRHAEAEVAFREAIALDPKLDRAWYGLGLALVRMQRPDEAIQALTRNTELQPMSPFGWVQLARVYVDRKEADEARRIIRHLKGFEPKFAAELERETGLVA